jgi:cellulose synthase/poly-beta-1,6-N-acetylglucosamine synthase-like glycosyltransferase
VIRRATGEIVVFGDARQTLHPAAIRELVANFADTDVGAVSGELILTDGSNTEAATDVGLYWRYEKMIRSAESRVDSTIGATGAIYAIRRSLFAPIPEDTLLDDVMIPLRIVRQGYRVVFEPGARAFDRMSAAAAQEFGRKARTIPGTFQLFSRERWLFNPRRNRLWFATMSHKGIRLLLPVLHAGALAANIMAAAAWPYQWLLGAHAMFYAAAAAGALQRRGSGRSKLFTLFFAAPYTLCLLCWADIVGFYRFAARRHPVTWERLPAASRAASEPHPTRGRVAA